MKTEQIDKAVLNNEKLEATLTSILTISSLVIVSNCSGVNAACMTSTSSSSLGMYSRYVSAGVT